MTFRAVSWHDAVLPQPLSFPPPYAKFATDPKGFSRFWQFAHYAFRLPDPSKFPPFPSQVADDEMASVQRFIASCRELASYSVMSAHDSVSFSTHDGVTTHTSEFSSSESIRGTAVLFRQLYGTDDGSYRVVQRVISVLHKTTKDEFTDLRDDMLVRWRKAHGALNQQRMEAIVGRMSANSYTPPGTVSEAPVPFEDLRPTEIIARYLNGDLLHWGDKRHSLEALGVDPMMADLDKLHFLEAMSGLAHYYLGFSILAARALRLPDPTI